MSCPPCSSAKLPSRSYIPLTVFPSQSSMARLQIIDLLHHYQCPLRRATSSSWIRRNPAYGSWELVLPSKVLLSNGTQLRVNRMASDWCGSAMLCSIGYGRYQDPHSSSNILKIRWMSQCWKNHRPDAAVLPYSFKSYGCEEIFNFWLSLSRMKLVIVRWFKQGKNFSLLC